MLCAQYVITHWSTGRQHLCAGRVLLKVKVTPEEKREREPTLRICWEMALACYQGCVTPPPLLASKLKLHSPGARRTG